MIYPLFTTTHRAPSPFSDICVIGRYRLDTSGDESSSVRPPTCEARREYKYLRWSSEFRHPSRPMFVFDLFMGERCFSWFYAALEHGMLCSCVSWGGMLRGETWYWNEHLGDDSIVWESCLGTLCGDGFIPCLPCGIELLVGEYECIRSMTRRFSHLENGEIFDFYC